MSKQSKRLKRRLARKERQRHYSETKQDYHHILFQGKHWQVGYAKLLRDHPYMGKYIPQYTLHREIHSKIHDVPTPNGPECRAAYYELVRREKEGLIDIEHDTFEDRIDFLIEMWEYKCPATVAILRWQREVVSKFYRRG